MARLVCTECGQIHRKNRSKHLRDKHGLNTRRGGIVAKYFIRPEALGISREALMEFEDGQSVVCAYEFPLNEVQRRYLQEE